MLLALHRGSFMKKILLIVGVNIFIVGVMLEFAFPRLFDIPHKVYRYWPNRMPSYWPNMSHRAVTPFYDVSFRSNSLGFKDKEHSFEKPEGVFRVLILGDSYVEAVEVIQEHHITNKLEALAKKRGIQLEAIGMGMSGHGQTHQLHNYEVLGKKFDPDLVVSLFCFNDLRDNHSNLAIHKITDDGKLVTNWSAPPQESALKKLVLREILNRTEAYHVVRYMMGGLHQFMEAPEKFFQPPKKLVAEASPEEYPKNPGVRQIFERLVLELKGTIQAEEGKKMLALMVSADVRQPYSMIAPMYDYVENVYRANAIPVINSHRMFIEKSKQTGELPHFDYDLHWNSNGHEWAAEQVWDYIETNVNLAAFKEDGHNRL